MRTHHVCALAVADVDYPGHLSATVVPIIAGLAKLQVEFEVSGDWVEFSARGSCVITGRSDATLNRGGVRLGTAEFYAVVEEIPEVGDSVVVHLEDPSGETTGELWLFVAPAAGSVIDDDVIARIRARLRSELSPRHLPDRVEVVRSVPRTLTGKRLEAPLKRLLRGEAVDRVASRESLADPTALDQFVGLAR